MITYCTNIHPGESWEATCANLQTHLLAVKQAVAPHQRFPIGLRLSQQAAMAIDDRSAQWFQSWCVGHDCYVPTINGFPFGDFHAGPIKEQVYLPDWWSPQRVVYTKKLAQLLDFWLPSGMIGSISTVPVGLQRHLSEADYGVVRQNLLVVLEYLYHLCHKSSKRIVLALEPEPACVLATTADVIAFWERMAFPEQLRDFIGICLDCCHLAVEFEEPKQSLACLAQAGIAIGKVQISSALRLLSPDCQVLGNFNEPHYLHQVVVKARDGSLRRYGDLPAAIMDQADHDRPSAYSYSNAEWRIHFHVPIFIAQTPQYATTRFFIEAILPLLHPDMLLEIETYTWHTLPAELRTQNVTDSIIREIKWLQEVKHSSSPAIFGSWPGANRRL